MKILFLTLVEIESLRDRGIYHDLVNQLLIHNHQVTLVTPRVSIRRNTVYKDGSLCNVSVATGSTQKNSPLKKAISFFFLPYQYINAIKKLDDNNTYDLIIYSTPPIMFYQVMRFFHRSGKVKTYLLLKDIFPQNAIDLGILNKKGFKSFPYMYYRWVEKRMYRDTSYIGTMSDANTQYLLTNNPHIDAKKVEVCPNSIQPVFRNLTIDDKNSIRNRYGIDNKQIVFLYGGNLGKPQGVEDMLALMESASSIPNIVFLIAGTGTESKLIEAHIKISQSQHIRYIGHQKKSDFDDLVCSSDVGLIFLDRRFTIPNYPSRLLSYLEAGIPVLAATDTTTDLAIAIQHGDFGLWGKNGDHAHFVENVKTLLDKPTRNRMGKNGISFLLEHFHVERTYDTIMSHFHEDN